MSLINEALKKAQRQRGGEAPPAVGAPSAAAPPASAPPPQAPPPAYPRMARRPAMPASTVALLAGGGVLLVALAIGAVVLLWPKEKFPAAPENVAAVKPAPVAPPTAPSATAVNSAPPPAQSVAPKPPAPANSPLPPLPALPSVAPAAVAATTAPVAPAPAPPPATIPAPINAAPPIAVAPPPPSPTVAPAPVAVPTSPAPAPTPVAPVAVSPTPPPAPAVPAVVTPPAPPRPDHRLDTLVTALRVTGVKAAAGDPEPRALIDNRVFKLGDILDRPAGLRLTKITPATLTFTDANGFDYEKKL
jgi:hypothetical protein